ncbi:hypothetical protein J2800_000973 [Caulobacter rhizosphaerae]|uniref:DUF6602 domain-containing protein n=1 Tax=Caulobacter rhizosphaerae TaxID=2010972 RepID=A0ABU1MVM6_9CAUL|nr:DUF6602 domain-containing protein [Caulobacter rhizosphaerae]MDR6530237.1 hypothetical protein [Caulobacter rhizosphaerae]
MTWLVGDLCVDTSAAWTGITVYEVTETGGALFLQPTMCDGLPIGGPPIPAPAAAGRFFVLPRLGQGLTPDLIRYRQITTSAEMILMRERRSKSPLPVEPKDLVAQISKRLRIARSDVSGVIRLRIGEGAYKILPTSTPLEIRLSDISRALERSRMYVGDLAVELRAQAERIGHLVSHGPSVGSYREDLVRDLLKRHLPERYHVATGFVQGSPRQADILIYDRLDYAVLFREGDVVVVQPDAVRAIIEVKSELTAENVHKSLDILRKICPLNVDLPPIFLGVIAFEGPQKPKTLLNWASKYYRGELNEKGKKPPAPIEEQRIEAFDDLVSAICVLDKTLITGGFARDPGFACLRPRLYEMRSAVARDVHAAMFINLLMDHLRYPMDSEQKDRFVSQMMQVEQVAGTEEIIEQGCGWGPYADYTGAAQARLEAQVRAYAAWRAGQRWSVALDDAPAKAKRPVRAKAKPRPRKKVVRTGPAHGPRAPRRRS